MPELTHDTAEDGFHEIQLSGKQLVFVGMTVTIVFVAIFLCGVLVGRNTRAPRDGDVVESAAAAPSVPASTDAAGPAATEPPAPPVEDELSYPKRLQGNPAPEELKSKPQAPPATAKPAPPTPPPAVDVPTTGRPGTWFVQVSALRNRAQAAALVKRLIATGHPAYLEMPARGAVEIYRVRVGRYSDRRDADKVARRLKADQLTADVKK